MPSTGGARLSLGDALKPAIKVATRGFVVDETFRQQTLDNKARFEAFTSTSSLFLPGGDAPAVGSVFQNHDLAETYRLLAKKGTDGFYGGPLAAEIAATVQAPPKTADTTLPVPAGYMTTADLAAYRALDQAPTHVDYRGLDVYGMAPSSSGGTTIGEALNILEHVQPVRDVQRRRPAPLPRGERAGLRGPRQVRGRPGVRWTSPPPRSRTRCSARSARA